MSDIIVAIFFIATIVGLKKPIYGSVAGLLLSIGYCYFETNIGIYSWVLMPIFGALFGFVFPLSVRWLFSGLRGGRGKNEPGTTYIGGFGVGREGQYFGKWADGIIPSENEETGWIENKQEKRKRNIGILIRYLSAPIILILAIIAFSLLHLNR
jgi:phosphate/sulfate permease